jgi:hypothetical protein
MSDFEIIKARTEIFRLRQQYYKIYLTIFGAAKLLFVQQK